MSADLLFYVTGGVALLATAMALTRAHAVHALLYVIVSLFATATLFFLLGAAFVAALEVIVYAGAIMVLFLFVLMMLNLDPRSSDMRVERSLLAPAAWVGPALLAAALGAELIALIVGGSGGSLAGGTATVVEPEAVAAALYGPYLLAVELASLLLLAGIVAAYHVARRGAEGAGGAGGSARARGASPRGVAGDAAGAPVPSDPARRAAGGRP